MHFTATVLLAFGMSMDAFAASSGKGATLHKPKFSEALRTGLIFGAVETLTPLIGWGLGILASKFVLEWNHWIAFVLLIFLGGRMIIEGIRGGSDEDETPLEPEVEFTQELLEKNNYVVLTFDNDVDWLQAQTLLGLKTVKSLDSKEGFEKKGIGRVMDGASAINKIINGGETIED